jgi:hypothetical protein
MSEWAGFITRPRISARSIKKASRLCDCPIRSPDREVTGKYLLEREKLIKENAWKLDDS